MTNTSSREREDEPLLGQLVIRRIRGIARADGRDVQGSVSVLQLQLGQRFDIDLGLLLDLLGPGLGCGDSQSRWFDWCYGYGGGGRAYGDLELARCDFEFLEGRVGVDGSAEWLDVLGADLGEVAHGFDVLAAHVTDALESSVRKRHEVLAAFLGLLLLLLLLVLGAIDVDLVVEFVGGAHGLRLREEQEIVRETLNVILVLNIECVWMH